MHEQECTDADEPYDRGGKRRDGDIGRHGAEPGLPTTPHQVDRKPVLQDEQIGRAHAEQDEGVPVEAVTQLTPSRPRQILITVSVSTSPIPRRSRLPDVAW